MYISQTRNVIIHKSILAFVLLPLVPQLRLFFFQHFKNLGNTFALSIVRNNDFAIFYTRLFEIREVRMLQRLNSRYSVMLVEAQHSGDEIQQRLAEQGRSSVLREMLQQTVF